MSNSGRRYGLFGALAILLIAFIAFLIWFGNREEREIKKWTALGDTISLANFLRTSDSSSANNSNLSLAMLGLRNTYAQDGRVDLEGLFFQLGPKHLVSADLLNLMRERSHRIKDQNRFVDTWIGLSSSEGHTSVSMEAIFKTGGDSVWGPILVSRIGASYANGELARAIGLSERVASLGLNPVHLRLKTSLEQFSRIQGSIPGFESRLEQINKEINEQEARLSSLKWYDLTAFLVDRIPSLGDNVYEIATFIWNGYGLQRNETAVLTTVETNFQTKGRFRMTVHPTGMKSFGRSSGGSVELPTFEEVGREEREEKARMELKLMSLLAARREVSDQISAAKASMDKLNEEIKIAFGWQPVKQAPQDAPDSAQRPVEPSEREQAG